MHADKFRLLILRDLVKELIGVLTYPHLVERYAVTPSMVQDMLLRLKDYALYLAPKRVLSLVADNIDNHILALAKEGNADFLVTGDREILHLNRIGNTAIVTPAAFLKELEK